MRKKKRIANGSVKTEIEEIVANYLEKLNRSNDETKIKYANKKGKMIMSN